MKRIIKIFPRKTAATPEDGVVNQEPRFFDEADEVHISVLFEWDLPRAEQLAEKWRHVAPVTIGGPATGERGLAFVPGQYVKKGYVISSRGCPNKCWFCSVWRREGQKVRELPLTEGYNLLDDNILACSDSHIKRVFAMLQTGKKKYKKPIEFTGGLEAARLKLWHAKALRELRPKQLFFAYDTPDDLEPLVIAGELMRSVGQPTAGHQLRCYVLCGYPKDNFQAAEKRMRETINAGFMPMAMLYRDKTGKRDPEWMRWQRQWARPAIIAKAI